MMKYVRKIFCRGKMTKLKYAVTQKAFREKHLPYLTLELTQVNSETEAVTYF